MNKQGVAVLAGLPPKLKRQTDFGCHSNPAGGQDVLGCKFGVSPSYLFGLGEQDFDALVGNLLDAGLLHHKLSNAEMHGPLT